MAIIFLFIFVLYLTIIWYFAYPSYQKITLSEFSRKSYILSNISFSAPLLLPWLLLSGTSDIINILPFNFPKDFLSTTYGQLSYFLVFLFIISIFGPAIIQKFWQCKPLENSPQRKRIEDLCKKAEIGFSEILDWPLLSGRMITAGVMGLISKFRYILVTKALLRFLEPEEIDAVIAHEIGHVKKHHLIFYLLFFSGYILFSYATFNLIVLLSIYLGPSFSYLLRTGISAATITSTIITLFLVMNFIIYFRYIFGFFMRNFERQADTYVYTFYNSAKPLISTLNKISLTSGQSPSKPNWHHFSINERIEYLNKCESDRNWINRQDSKIRQSILIFCSGLILIGILGYVLNFGQTGKALTANVMETILIRELDSNPRDFNLYNALGDINYQKTNFPKTIQAYEKSLSIAMDNPHALNNLAWLYATCDHVEFRNPKRALELALKAAQIRKEPHILDTLAESYFVNNMYNEAVATEMKALELAKADRSHYEKQLIKYRKALTKSK
ncbi:MAG: M48 family metalloprotease [Deltaproteobacteria bacterium]|nr:M48 family metalloprotease [Deltaproteobacteria bacterium]